jgi:hypothetical protein
VVSSFTLALAMQSRAREEIDKKIIPYLSQPLPF